jgi:hypothetical protein
MPFRFRLFGRFVVHPLDRLVLIMLGHLLTLLILQAFSMVLVAARYI